MALATRARNAAERTVSRAERASNRAVTAAEATADEIAPDPENLDFGNTRAQNDMMQSGVQLAVGILVVALLTAYLLPIALDELAAVDTSSWGDAESALFGILPLFFVLAILLFVVNKAVDT